MRVISPRRQIPESYLMVSKPRSKIPAGDLAVYPNVEAIMLLQAVLKKENNNLDFFRICAAGMVIIAHSFTILPHAGGRDLFANALKFDDSGSLAVKMFFFISGLVVMNSLLSKNNFFQFAIARFFRIWPALAAVLIITAFVIGPFFTTWPLKAYFSDASIYIYVVDGLSMHMKTEVAGIFAANPSHVVNISLWTIPLEVSAYMTLAALFLVGALQSRKVATLAYGLIALDCLTGGTVLFTWLPKEPNVLRLAPCFAMGALAALWKEKIRIDVFVVGGLWLLFYVFKKSSANFFIFYCAFFYTILYISSRPFMLKLKPSADISYGVYLWGWPVQQILAAFLPNQSILAHQISAILIAMLFGFLSWHLLEKHFIKMGSALSRRYGNHFVRGATIT